MANYGDFSTPLDQIDKEVNSLIESDWKDAVSTSMTRFNVALRKQCFHIDMKIDEITNETIQALSHTGVDKYVSSLRMIKMQEEDIPS